MDQEKVKVLVVDDDTFVSEMLATILKDGDYDVATAHDGAEALGKFNSDPDIGLVISDMNMPGMSGLELIHEIRGENSDIPIIILTGNNEISVAIEAINSGANDYLLKDENIQDTIILSVEKVLEKHNLKKQNVQLMEDLARENERLEQEKALAQKVQTNILPQELSFKGLDIGTFYMPSDKIGGDFFDAWETGGRVHFLIADVSGHSTSSALLMAVGKGIFQSLGHSIEDPQEIVSTANRMLCNILTDSGMFLSLIYGIFEKEGDKLSIISAGHNPVFLVEDGTVRTIDSTGAVIGWDPDDTWEVHSTSFTTGAMLVLYTDGLTEAKNASGEEFGEERLENLLKGDFSSGEMIEKIFQEVQKFCGGEFYDDLTLFVLRRQQGV